jgi:hypothetical protein
MIKFEINFIKEGIAMMSILESIDTIMYAGLVKVIGIFIKGAVLGIVILCTC